jgi:hypothetical protein
MTDRTLFEAALERSDPAERARFLNEACGGDLDQRRRVEELLRNHERSGDFLGPPPALVEAVRDLIEHAANPPQIPERPGRSTTVPRPKKPRPHRAR